MILDSGINRSGTARRGIKHDESRRKALTKREQKRKTIQEANTFAETLAKICPEYFGD